MLRLPVGMVAVVIDQEREAHRDEVIRVARQVIQGAIPSVFGVPNPHIKALRDEIEALDQYEQRHPKDSA